MAEREAVDWRTRCVAWAGAWLVRVLASTWRVRFHHDAAVTEARRTGQPVVFTLWHGTLLPLLWAHRYQQISVMISDHRDGEIIARIARMMGYRIVRGSSSRGAIRVLVGMVREVESGHTAAVTPDGPRGPLHSFAPGALLVSQRSGSPVVPVAAVASRAWVLKSWDHFVIPKPFARVAVSYGDFIAPPTVGAEGWTAELDPYLRGMAQAVARAEGADA